MSWTGWLLVGISTLLILVVAWAIFIVDDDDDPDQDGFWFHEDKKEK